MQYCFELTIHYCPACQRWAGNQPLCSACGAECEARPPDTVGPGMLAAYVPEAFEAGRLRIARMNKGTLAIEPELARLLLGLLTEQSSVDFYGSAVAVHAGTPEGCYLLARHWQGRSELGHEELREQLQSLIEQLQGRSEESGVRSQEPGVQQ